MEEGITNDPFIMNALTLAFIGDAVFELAARAFALKKGSHQVAKLHRHTIALVKASSQARMADDLLDTMNEKEKTIFRRGRNSSPANIARHQSISNYKKATGLEAVFGYLYLSGQYERMNDLFSMCVRVAENNAGSLK